MYPFIVKITLGPLLYLTSLFIFYIGISKVKRQNNVIDSSSKLELLSFNIDLQKQFPHRYAQINKLNKFLQFIKVLLYVGLGFTLISIYDIQKHSDFTIQYFTIAYLLITVLLYQLTQKKLSRYQKGLFDSINPVNKSALFNIVNLLNKQQINYNLVYSGIVGMAIGITII